jgi:predicted component of type VI protein secretion system
MLPYVVLKGSGVAIGRGKEALWAVGGTGSSAGTPRSVLANGCDRNLTEVLKRNLGFVEVADGRVSRLHCIISLGCDADGAQQAMLEDCSSNGTFLNHKKLAKGESGEEQLG